MNTTINYLPNGDTDRNTWMNNFNIKLPGYASLIGVTPAEIISVKNDTAGFGYILGMIEVHRQTVIALTSYKNLMKHASGRQHLGSVPALPALPGLSAPVTEGVFDRISKLVKRIKTSVNYTEHIGHDLGIIAPVKTDNTLLMKPLLKIKLKAGKPYIHCRKGTADAIDLYVDRKDNTGYIYLTRLIKFNYIDNTPLPENGTITEWSYKAMYVKGNNSIGLMSAATNIIVKKL